MASASVCKEYLDDIQEVLFSEAKIAEIVRLSFSCFYLYYAYVYRNMGRSISAHYRPLIDRGEKLLIVGLLTGCYPFLADLVRYISVPCEVDFM